MPVIAGVYRIRIFGQVGALPVGNDIALRTMTVSARPSAHDVGVMVGTHWSTLAADRLNAEYAGVSVGVYDLTTASSPLVEVPLTAPGAVVSAVMPINICALIRHDVAHRGKIGKTFLGPVSISQTDAANNNLSTSGRTDYQNAWTTFENGIKGDTLWAGATVDFGIISLITAKAYLPQFLPSVASTAETKLASQNRRRLR
jgi:hypothetical protein